MMRACLIVVILGILFSLTPTASTAQNLISNSTFDSGIEDWMTDGTGPGTITWDAAQGQPPGALRFPDFDQTAIAEDCIIPQAGIFTLSTDAYLETSGEFILCSVNFLLYQTVNCSGEGGPIVDVEDEGIFPFVTDPNTWQRLEFEFGLPQITIDEAPFSSMRPMLVKLGDFGSDDACLYDNVSLTYTPLSVTEVPAVGSLGLVVLAALLGVAGLFTVRRLPAG